MSDEVIILDERLDTTVEDIKKLVSAFFFNWITLPYGIDVAFKVTGNKQIWAIKPEDRNDGVATELINGYIEISGLFLDSSKKPVHVRIVSFREELIQLWLELANYIKSSLLFPNFPATVITKELTKDVLLGVISKSTENLLAESSLPGFTTEQKVKIDNACIGWARRDPTPRIPMFEYLQEFEHKDGIYLTVDQFKRALKDAGRRGLIVKQNGRWRMNTPT